VGWARTAVAWSLWAAAQYHFKWPTAGPSAVLSSALSSELKPWGTPIHSAAQSSLQPYRGGQHLSLSLL
jgi:hypothetical protein